LNAPTIVRRPYLSDDNIVTTSGYGRLFSLFVLLVIQDEFPNSDLNLNPPPKFETTQNSINLSTF